MEKIRETKKRFLNEIKKNNICISENPKGTDIFWPKSYAILYYQYSLSKIYNQNKAPVILQINEPINIIDNLWNGFFKNPKIKNEFLSTNKSLLIFKELYKDYLFDIIIIKQYKNIKNINQVINFLKSKLKTNGVIIIESVSFDIKFVTELFFKHSSKIFDFRINRFLIDNCIIEIKRYSSIKKIFYRFSYLPRYIFHLIVDSCYYSFNILKRIAK